MDNIESALKKVGEDVTLSSGEREKMSFVLREYMAIKPVRAVSAGKGNRPFVVRGVILQLQTFIRKPMPIALALALLLTGSVSYAAEGSVPGDMLYPVKVGVNEEVRSALTLSTEAKASWEARLAERRLEEAARLAAQGRLDTHTQAELQARFENHADRATNSINRVREEDSEAALRLVSDFETHLSGYGDILATFRGDGTDADDEGKDDARELTESVRSRVSLVGAVRAEVNANLGSLAELHGSASSTSSDAVARGEEAAERAMKEAERAYRTAVDLYAKASAKLSAEESARVKVELSTIERVMLEGKGMIEAGNYANAVRTYRDAFTASQKLQISLRAVIDLNVRTPILRIDADTQTDTMSSIRSHDSERDGEDEPDEDSSVDARGVIRSTTDGFLKLGL